MRIAIGSVDETYEQAPDLVLVFATREKLTQADFDPILNERFPEALIAGCVLA